MWGRCVADLPDGGCRHEASCVRLEILLGVLATHGLAITGRVGWTAWVVKPVGAAGCTWVHRHTGGTTRAAGAGVALVKSWTWALHAGNRDTKVNDCCFWSRLGESLSQDTVLKDSLKKLYYALGNTLINLTSWSIHDRFMF